MGVLVYLLQKGVDPSQKFWKREWHAIFSAEIHRYRRKHSTKIREHILNIACAISLVWSFLPPIVKAATYTRPIEIRESARARERERARARERERARQTDIDTYTRARARAHTHTHTCMYVHMSTTRGQENKFHSPLIHNPWTLKIANRWRAHSPSSRL